MNAEQQRIAIAEKCGWTWQGSEEYLPTPDPNRKLWFNQLIDDEYHFLPDYPHDLNAVHEAEKFAGSVYWRTLLKVLEPREASPHIDIWMCIEKVGSATASQRCEALCRTWFPERFTPLQTA